MVKSWHLKTKTSELNITMVAIFISQFINTVVIIVAVHANLSELIHDDSFGTETDFGVTWYKIVGTTIIHAMLS